MSFVQLKNVNKHYGKTHVLKGINLEFSQTGHYALVGASGSGKSTLLYLLGGLDRASSGEIEIEGKKIDQLDDDELSFYRNSYIGFVFQFHFLLPSMNCLNNIMLPARIGGGKEIEKVKKNAIKMAEFLGVSHCLTKMPYELSGGEQQRINIVRAISLRPKILLCDEPTGNLDSQNSQKVTQLLKDLASEFGSTLIVVTHDEKVATHFNNKITIEDGQIIS